MKISAAGLLLAGSVFAGITVPYYGEENKVRAQSELIGSML
jgi:hypothetical protein